MFVVWVRSGSVMLLRLRMSVLMCDKVWNRVM